MQENVIDKIIKDEIKENLMEFYKSHKDECDAMYSDAVDKDKLDIYEEIEDIHLRDQLLFKAEIVILTANIFEKTILHTNAVKAKQQRIYHCIVDPYKNQRYPVAINIYFFEIEDFHILHMEAKQTGSYSIGGSADLVRYIINNNHCFPSVVISYGICFGNKYDDQRIGDTIIAEKIYPYFMSAKVGEEFFLVKDSNIFNIDTKLSARIQYLKGRGELSENDRIFCGNMVTGEAVISNTVMKNIFIKAATNQPILGGEMEGYGLFKECQGFEYLIPCMIIKSICDWGAYKNLDDDDTKGISLKDKLQVYAAVQAYKVLAVLLRKDSKIFEISIYEQVKKAVSSPVIRDGGVLNLSLLKDMLNKNVINTPKRYENIDTVCEMILEELVKDKVIKYIKENVYRIIY